MAQENSQQFLKVKYDNLDHPLYQAYIGYSRKNAACVLLYQNLRRFICRSIEKAPKLVKSFVENGLLVAFPGQEKLAKLLGIKREAIPKMIQRLRDWNWIETKDTGKGLLYILGRIEAGKETYYLDEVLSFHDNVVLPLTLMMSPTEDISPRCSPPTTPDVVDRLHKIDKLNNKDLKYIKDSRCPRPQTSEKSSGLEDPPPASQDKELSPARQEAIEGEQRERQDIIEYYNRKGLKIPSKVLTRIGRV